MSADDMSADNISANETTNEPRISVSSKSILAMKRRFILGMNILSLAGCMIAFAQVVNNGIGAVEISLFLLMYSLTGVGITVGFHHYFTHRCFETFSGIKILLAVLGSMAGHGPLISWTATHRCHHKYSDGPHDPHSPNLHGAGAFGRIKGLWHAHMGWLLNSSLPNSSLFAKDLIRDPALRVVNRLYLLWVLMGLAIPALLGGILTVSWNGAWLGLLWGGLVRFFFGFHATCSINSLTHSIGRRPWGTREQSTNLALLALPTFGEAWHNNHHASPASAKFGLRWWQLDLGYLVIRGLEILRLIWNVKVVEPDVERTGVPTKDSGE